MSGMEIERKFLVHKNHEYKSQAFASSRIKQGYIAAKGATVRVRLRDDKGYLTIKGPSEDGGLSRYEFERKSLPMKPRTFSGFANQEPSRRPAI